MKTQTSGLLMQRSAGVGAALAVTLLLGVAIACRSSSSGPTCTGEVVYQSTTYTGEAGNVEDAQRFACNKYCLEADSEFDAHYHIWLDSPKGKEAGSPPKKESIYKDKDLMEYLTVQCAMRCVASVKQGKMQGSAKCQ